MGFSPQIAAQALLDCGCSCCLCQKFSGTKIECHHIIQESEGGLDTYDNCVPLCFDCHAEVASYNPKHPKGRKITSAELKGHRDRWYAKRRATGAPDAAVTVITEQNVIDAFKAIQDFTEDDVREHVAQLHRDLLKNGVVTMKQLFELVSSAPILNQVRKIYVDLLKRPFNKPLDPFAVAEWGGIFFSYGLREDIVNEVCWHIKQSDEYFSKQQIQRPIVSNS
jgi:hypothetical protein